MANTITKGLYSSYLRLYVFQAIQKLLDQQSAVTNSDIVQYLMNKHQAPKEEKTRLYKRVCSTTKQLEIDQMIKRKEEKTKKGTTLYKIVEIT